jgi:hypothetical protein
MKGPLEAGEYQVVLEKVFELGFTTIYTQEIESVTTYIPDFFRERPFAMIMRSCSEFHLPEGSGSHD